MRISLSTLPESPWEKESKAVIASDHGSGRVLWYAGKPLYYEMVHAGLCELEDLGLDNAPHGISIWEGCYSYYAGGSECPSDGWTEPCGKFRNPTPKEWEAIMRNESPWEGWDGYLNDQDE